jgi:hypothetical protein
MTDERVVMEPADRKRHGIVGAGGITRAARTAPPRNGSVIHICANSLIEEVRP